MKKIFLLDDSTNKQCSTFITYYGESQLNFYVSKDGKKYFNLGYYNGSLAPLGKWLKEYVQEAKTYLKNHPDVMYKF